MMTSVVDDIDVEDRSDIEGQDVALLSSINVIDSSGMYTSVSSDATGSRSASLHLMDLLQSISSAECSVGSLLALSGQRSIIRSLLLGENKRNPQSSSRVAPTTSGHDRTVASLYLSAAAKQLPAFRSSAASKPSWSFSTSAVSNEVVTLAHLNDIAETVGFCASQCQPRSFISTCGIIPVLASLFVNSNTSCYQCDIDCPILSTVQTEFLQVCIYASQFDYASRMVSKTWPTPNKIFPVQQVLRYFYLRGVVHMSCDNEVQLAMRCFETCLVIPSDNVAPKIAIDALKKLVLMQCFYYAMDVASLYNHPKILDKKKSAQHPGPTPASAGMIPFSEDTLSLVHDPSKQLPSPLSLPKGLSTAIRDVLSKAFSTSSDPKSQLLKQQQAEYDDPESSVMHVVENRNNQTDNMNDDQNDPSHPGNLQSDVVRKNPSSQIKLAARSVKLYCDLASAFVRVDRATFLSIMSKPACKRKLEEDGNFELVQRCFDFPLLHRHVLLVSTMFSYISLQDLQNQLQLSSTSHVKTILLNLATKYFWCIEIDQDTDYVKFPRFSALSTVNTTESATIQQELIRLTQLVQKKTIDVTTSPAYSSLMIRSPAGTGKQKKSGGPRGVEEF